MTNPIPAPTADGTAEQPGPAPASSGFHVELTPVPSDARPFHALHGTVPMSPVPRLPSHIEEVIVHPLTKLP